MSKIYVIKKCMCVYCVGTRIEVLLGSKVVYDSKLDVVNATGKPFFNIYLTFLKKTETKCGHIRKIGFRLNRDFFFYDLKRNDLYKYLY